MSLTADSLTLPRLPAESVFDNLRDIQGFDGKCARVYVASCFLNFPQVKQLSEDWHEIEFTNQWSEIAAAGLPNDPHYARAFWPIDVADIARSDILLIIPRTPDGSGLLRGAIFEAGIAVALHKRVILVGDCPEYSTWQWHPAISHAPCLEKARIIIQLHSMVLS